MDWLKLEEVAAVKWHHEMTMTAWCNDERARKRNNNAPLHGHNGKTSNQQQKRQLAGRRENKSHLRFNIIEKGQMIVPD